MQMYPESKKIQAILNDATHIVVIQADNPDADSLASSLVLEHILSDMGKQVTLYCGVNLPSYLAYLPGHDRVVDMLPTQFDAAIIVDTSASSLLEQLSQTGQDHWLKTKPVIVIDHHDVPLSISYVTVGCVHPAVATGEVIYELATQLNWPINLEAKRLITTSIMADSMGLTSGSTTARSIMIISELVAGGVSIAALEQARRLMNVRSLRIAQYKGQLLQRIEITPGGHVASVTIPWEEIETYSQEYNPAVLVLDEMRLLTNVAIAIVFKVYPNGRITGKIRANYGAPIANQLAELFGGGGHAYASGFKVQDGRSFEDIKSACLHQAEALLTSLDQVAHETL
jgi:phosphoesterase RecJ-like protein